MNSVLLDTSFLISFSDTTRAHHATALRYPEFQVRQPINDLPLRNFIILPFNVDHAMACGLLLNSMPRDEADDRVRVKDDFKLMAQCECEGITHLFCEDAKTLAKYVARRITSGGPNTTRAILMKDGFDGSWFDNGQAHLPYE